MSQSVSWDTLIYCNSGLFKSRDHDSMHFTGSGGDKAFVGLLRVAIHGGGGGVARDLSHIHTTLVFQVFTVLFVRLKPSLMSCGVPDGVHTLVTHIAAISRCLRDTLHQAATVSRLQVLTGFQYKACTYTYFFNTSKSLRNGGTLGRRSLQVRLLRCSASRRLGYCPLE